MEMIVYVDENGTQEGDCDFRAIQVCEEDEQSLFVMIGHFLANGNKLEKVRVLSEKEYQELLKFRDTHPDYIKYVEASQYITKFDKKYNKK